MTYEFDFDNSSTILNHGL